MREWTNSLIQSLNELAALENSNKHLYRPATYIHKWWARRPGSVFRTILLTALSEDGDDPWQLYYEGMDFHGKIVLDPFMGGGTTVAEALRLNCRVVGCELNPVAWWTVKKAIEPVQIEDLRAGFAAVRQAVAKVIQACYQTTCPHCQNLVDAVHLFWVNQVPCPDCGHVIALHPNWVLDNRKKTQTVFCPECGAVFAKARNIPEAMCPVCHRRFDVAKGIARTGSFFCEQCQRWQSIGQAIRRSGKPFEAVLFALMYYCPVHGQGFKAADAGDRQLYAEVAQRFEAEKDSCLFPRQSIPDGHKTGDLLAYNYRYWYQLFNSRQLWCLDCLLRAILGLPDENVQEFLLTLFSAALEFNNMFCGYKGAYASKPGAVRHIFAHHAFVFPKEPLENNLWGVERLRSSGSFAWLFQTRLLRAKQFCHMPVERVVKGGKVISKLPMRGERIEGHLAQDFAELVGTDKNALLLCQDSAQLPLPDCAVDVVVTDPPYFDNVMYSELADFFYVWLRLGLKNRYLIFRPELSPKGPEVVMNPNRGKDADSFAQGLTQVFQECHRVLKDDGVLVFTFHHKRGEAWKTVLQAILEADFFVTATYPVNAESRQSVHIYDQESVEYDVIIFCRKRQVSPKVTWDRLHNDIQHRARETLQLLMQANAKLRQPDASVVVFGKCLEGYSLHYPNVFRGGERVGIDEAVAAVDQILQSLDKKPLTSAPKLQEQLPKQLALLDKQEVYCPEGEE